MEENSRCYLAVQLNCLIVNQKKIIKYIKSANFKKKTTSKDYKETFKNQTLSKSNLLIINYKVFYYNKLLYIKLNIK